jgi:hypothetical protein
MFRGTRVVEEKRSTVVVHVENGCSSSTGVEEYYSGIGNVQG